MLDRRCSKAPSHNAWTLASAALPQGWALMGLMRGPAGDHDMDPVVSLEGGWYAWAVSSDRLERVEGNGPYPHRALLDLAARLRERRVGPNG